MRTERVCDAVSTLMTTAEETCRVTQSNTHTQRESEATFHSDEKLKTKHSRFLASPARRIFQRTAGHKYTQHTSTSNVHGQVLNSPRTKPTLQHSADNIERVKTTEKLV